MPTSFATMAQARSAYLAGSRSNPALTLALRDTRAMAANFYKAFPSVQREARRLVRQKGEFTKDLIKLFAPKDTWFMTNHANTWYSPDGLAFTSGWDASEFAAAGLPFYPVFQEFGTRFHVAQPSLGPAYREAERIFRQDTKRMYQRALKRSLRRGGRS